MKKYLLLFSVIILGLSSCKKEAAFDAAAQAVKDEAAIQAYLSANPGITATRDPSGLYYQVITEGPGNHPSSASNVTVNYTGKFLSGTVFESGTVSATSLGSLIKGWQIGVPYARVGGRVLLIIPSGLAYGNNASGSIPKNSVLIFTIDLLGYTN